MRKLAVVGVVLVLGAAGLFLYAGRMAGPGVKIVSPDKYVGVATPLAVTIDAPRGVLSAARISFEQNGTRTPLFDLSQPAAAKVDHNGTVTTITQDVGRQAVPTIVTGAARIVVSASRPVLFGLRTATTEIARDVQVRLDRPKVFVVSTGHYVNLGGSEMVVYRVSPNDVQSGVMVGDLTYPGYPGSGATVEGVRIADPGVRVAFFALRYDQALSAPMRLYARDEAGNVSYAEFDHRTFPKAFKKSRIEISDEFLQRVVPAILQGSPEIKPSGSLLDQFLKINGELRRKNAEKIQSLAAGTSRDMLWQGVPFHAFANTKVESAFADYRTYFYQGKDVDSQVHLGFDLASFAGTPIVAANRGKVLYADELGIFGNCVIIDHGMGVQSLYAHLSAFDVQAGAMVEKEQQLGRSGLSGLAAGDHLHFTMLVNGQPVNPIEWWDPHWVEDRVVRKLREAR
jgi:murein DD-endopeptidase MepM/ murein hydrolase activator NlpD